MSESFCDAGESGKGTVVSTKKRDAANNKLSIRRKTCIFETSADVLKAKVSEVEKDAELKIEEKLTKVAIQAGNGEKATRLGEHYGSKMPQNISRQKSRCLDKEKMYLTLGAKNLIMRSLVAEWSWPYLQSDGLCVVAF